jgi:hypothetical protein
MLLVPLPNMGFCVVRQMWGVGLRPKGLGPKPRTVVAKPCLLLLCAAVVGAWLLFVLYQHTPSQPWASGNSVPVPPIMLDVH